MNLIIGNGLIAKSFMDKSIPNNIIIFSSGVSNSQCTRSEDFNREKILLQEIMYKNKNKKIVYFSSCSIDYTNKNKYILHKLNMENLLSAHYDYKIYRITQIVGMTTNNTLISYFTKALMRNERVLIHKNAKRNIIDIEDLSRIVITDLNSNFNKNIKISYIKSGQSIDVLSIYKKIATILKLPLNYEILESGDNLNINEKNIISLVNKTDPINQDSYWEKVLEKYITNLKRLINETCIN